MHLHILGICGTFMGGIAALARASGHKVTGCDRNVYPPMSTQLAALGIDLIEGYEADQLALEPDVFVIGNVLSRGNPLVEAILDSGRPYESGPGWLARNVLVDRWVLAVAGTHGKTTTSSLLAWILEHAGLDPGFLVGGVPVDFQVSARLGSGHHFVVEADEYDTAFFDKRAKFVHYRPRTAILNNLEHDHADIYPDVIAIQRQFHLLLRTMPGNGRLVVNARDRHLAEVLEMGCWTPVERYSLDPVVPADWQLVAGDAGYGHIEIRQGARSIGAIDWRMFGRHNAENALAAFVAARHAGVEELVALEALARFGGVRRRLELRGNVDGVLVYDDFAHHPTAISNTLDGVRQRQVNGRAHRRARAALQYDEARRPQGGARRFAAHGGSRLHLPSPEVHWDVAGDAALGSVAVVQTISASSRPRSRRRPRPPGGSARSDEQRILWRSARASAYGAAGRGLGHR